MYTMFCPFKQINFSDSGVRLAASLCFHSACQNGVDKHCCYYMSVSVSLSFQIDPEPKVRNWNATRLVFLNRKTWSIDHKASRLKAHGVQNGTYESQSFIPPWIWSSCWYHDVESSVDSFICFSCLAGTACILISWSPHGPRRRGPGTPRCAGHSGHLCDDPMGRWARWRTKMDAEWPNLLKVVVLCRFVGPQRSTVASPPNS